MRDLETRRKSHNAWASRNRQTVRDRVAKWQAENPEKMKANHERWRLAHPEKHRANVAARKATKLAQRCICCADEDIQKVYDIAILCGDGAHVDHKTPLRLGGHHCAKNLQPMLAHEHIEKTKLDNRAIADAKRRSRLLQNWRIAA